MNVQGAAVIPRQYLKLLARGFAIFPVRHRGKEPLTPHGFKDASCEPAHAELWTRRWPSCNWGVALGSASRCMVLDFDTKDGLANFECEHGKLPATYTVRTARGMHLYFRLPEGGASTRVFDDGELRSDGAYVVAEGSIHPSGSGYKCIADIAIADFPPAIAEHFQAQHPTAEACPDAAISEGQRNAKLASLAGTMRQRSFGQRAIEAALLVENVVGKVCPL